MFCSVTGVWSDELLAEMYLVGVAIVRVSRIAET